MDYLEDPATTQQNHAEESVAMIHFVQFGNLEVVVVGMELKITHFVQIMLNGFFR